MRKIKLPRIGAVSLVLFIVATLLAIRVSADDWPQWRGPHRNGKSDETGLLQKWPEQGPKVIWAVEGIGRGHSSPSVKDNIVYATGMIDRTDYLQAIDPEKFAIVSQFRVEAGAGPHWAHPAISNGILYIRHGDTLTACDIREPGNSFQGKEK